MSAQTRKEQGRGDGVPEGKIWGGWLVHRAGSQAQSSDHISGCWVERAHEPPLGALGPPR